MSCCVIILKHLKIMTDESFVDEMCVWRKYKTSILVSTTSLLKCTKEENFI